MGLIESKCIFPPNGKKWMNAEWQIFNLTTNTLPPPWQRDQCVLLAGGICAPEAAKRQQHLIYYRGPIWFSYKNPIWRPHFNILHTNKSPAAPNSPSFPPPASHSRAVHVRMCVSFIVRFTGQNLDPADIWRKVSLLVKTSSIRESSGFPMMPQMYWFLSSSWYSIRLFVWHCEHKQKSHDHFKDYSC